MPTKTSERAAAQGRRNRHVLLCNGAPAPAQARGGAAAGNTWELRTFGSRANVRLRVDDITDAMGQLLPDEVLDLLELAAVVYAADQCCGRTPGRRFEYGTVFRRDLVFRAAVRRPDFWSRPEVRDALADTLHFLSDDDYNTFEFSTLADPPGAQAYLFGGRGPAPGPVDQVMLMSGGLDSLAGAIQQAIREGRRLAMVSHRPVAHVTTRQRRLVAGVAGRAAGRAGLPVHVPVTCNKLGLEEHDVTQRSRSFLYAALGAAVAGAFGLSEVWFYENGVTSVNLPLCAQEVGARATRTTHPRAMHGFGRVLSLAFGRPVAARNGFLWHTKRDVLDVVRADGGSGLARSSVSCSHTRRTSNASPHCGLCSQCLARRVAAIGAAYGPDDPTEGYRVDPMTGDRPADEDRVLAERFIGEARAVSRMTAVREFDLRYAGHLGRVYPYLDMPTGLAAEKLFDLHLRHAEQVAAAVEVAARTHFLDGWRGRLGATAALTYAFGLVGPGRGAGGGRRARVTAGRSGPAGASSDSADGEPASGPPSVDPESCTVRFGGGEYTFPPRSKELFALMARIARRPGHRVTFAQLREAGDVWDGGDPEDASIRSAVSRLRRRLTDEGLGGLADAISCGTHPDGPFVILNLPA